MSPRWHCLKVVSCNINTSHWFELHTASPGLSLIVLLTVTLVSVTLVGEVLVDLTNLVVDLVHLVRVLRPPRVVGGASLDKASNHLNSLDR